MSVVGASLTLHLSVLYTPLNEHFGTVPLGISDWGLLAVVPVVGGPFSYSSVG